MLSTGAVLSCSPIFSSLRMPAIWPTASASGRSSWPARSPKSCSMSLGIAAILYGNMNVMYVLLFLMGTHSTVFSPPKYGALPEMVRADRLATANGLVGMTTVLAIVLGTAGGAMLYDHRVRAGCTTGGFGPRCCWAWRSRARSPACLSARCTRPIHSRRFPVNLVGQTVSRHGRPGDGTGRCCWPPWAGAVFWSIGAPSQLNVYLFVRRIELSLTDQTCGHLAGRAGPGRGAAT